MSREKIESFKRSLSGITLKLKTVDGDVIIGVLASKSMEKKIISKSIIPFPVDLSDYFVLIREEEKVASFLLASEIDSIDCVD